MRWRLKTRYWTGFRDQKRLHYDPEQPILPGCHKPEERRKLNKMAKTMSEKDLNAAARKLLAFDKDKNGKEKPKSSPVVLELDLRHGDYMVMHGADMQKYYEVSVSRT